MFMHVSGAVRQIDFARLTEIPPYEILEHMSDPRVARHMPLMNFKWDQERLAVFIAMKEEAWRRDGLGHWAFLVDGIYVGWGGFQNEGDEWDYGLVLKPGAFGFGPMITRKAIAFARADARIAYVTFLLPPSRKHPGSLGRLGARLAGEVTYQNERFLKFSLDTNS